MSDSEKSARSGRSIRSKQSSNLTRTEYMLLEAASRKAELEYRTEALQLRQAIERKEYELQQTAKLLEQEREMLAMTSQLKIEQAKIEILQKYESENSLYSSSSRRSSRSLQQLPQATSRSTVQQWLISSTSHQGPAPLMEHYQGPASRMDNRQGSASRMVTHQGPAPYMENRQDSASRMKNGQDPATRMQTHQGPAPLMEHYQDSASRMDNRQDPAPLMQNRQSSAPRMQSHQSSAPRMENHQDSASHMENHQGPVPMQTYLSSASRMDNRQDPAPLMQNRQSSASRMVTHQSPAPYHNNRGPTPRIENRDPASRIENRDPASHIENCGPAPAPLPMGRNERHQWIPDPKPAPQHKESHGQPPASQLMKHNERQQWLPGPAPYMHNESYCLAPPNESYGPAPAPQPMGCSERQDPAPAPKPAEPSEMLAILSQLVKLQQQAALPEPEIDKFDGSDVTSFPSFMKKFKLLVEDVTEEPSRRLEMLMKFTKQEARDLIKDCILLSEPTVAYQRAIALLQETYGHPALLATSYKQKAESWPKVKSGDKEALKKYSVFLTNSCTARRGNQHLQNVDSFEFLKILAIKLPTPLQQKWITQVGVYRDVQNKSPTLEDFSKFVQQLARDENDPRISGLGYQGRANQDNNGYKKRKETTTTKKVMTAKVSTGAKETTHHDRAATNNDNAATDTDDKAASAPCLYCGDGTKHSILECRKFKGLDRNAKNEACKQKGLCFGCLNKGHSKKTCPQLRKCSKCQKAHPTVMHDPNWKPKSNNNQKVNDTATQVLTGCVGVKDEICTRTGTNKSDTPGMAIVPVIVKSKASDKGVSTYAFLDNGSGAVFVDQELSAALHTRTKQTKLFLKTINSEEIMETSVVTDELQIGDIEGTTFIDLPEVYVRDQIPVGKNDIPAEKDVKKWKHLQDIKVPKLQSTTNSDCIPRVTILVGINVPAATTPLESKIGKIGEPYALKTPLGWLMYGVPGTSDRATSVNFCKISCLTTVQKGDDLLEEQLKKYMNLEFTECLCSDYNMPSKEDKKFLQLMEENVQLRDGHYEAPLPFRNENVTFPNNYQQANMFLQLMKRRFTRDKDLHHQYSQFMNNMEDKGYCERVPPEELQRSDNKLWYIPHHAVKHLQKGSVRVVFNCPASYKGTSLNGELLQGPDLANRLLGILLRWRKGDVALMADIESMFSQVRVPSAQRDMLRYLWCPEGDMTKDPQEYRMKVHVFGAISSPSCANYTLKKCAEDNENEYGKKVTEAIQKDFYVDDFVRSTDTQEEAIELAHGVRQVLSKGGFNLTKWISNEREVLQTIPEEHHVKEVKNRSLNDDNLPTERTLGALWDVENDEIGFASKDLDSKATRRNILSVTSSIYDPIGPTAPYVLKAKMILQALCKEKIGWDEPIPEILEQQWKKWLEDLPKLERLRINRAYQPKGFGKIVNRQVHFFSDASQDGYGTVSYLRQVNEDNEIHVEFLTAKSRVAPLKRHTIPRMELTAATSAVKQYNMIKNELSMEIDQVVFWTDSTTVLNYIKNEKSRFPVFVANRLAIIHDGSSQENWRYIPTHLNPADHASRGLSAEDLSKKTEWLKGPSFLQEPEDTWVDFSQPLSAEQENDAEETCQENYHVSVNTATIAEEPDPVNCILEYYSDWTKLRRGVAWWLRLKALLQKPRKKPEVTVNENKTLSVEEIQKAEQAIVQYVQHQCFTKEISMLKKTTDKKEDLAADSQKSVDKRSTIASLDPELKDGMLRVGGRLRHARIPQNAKHQLILPKNHHVSTLIIRHTHRRVHHQGRNHVLAELRQRFWVINARAKVKSVLGKCVICRKYQAQVGRQKMADLPTYRVQADDPAFAITGVDYFGPFLIKQGRVTRKRYGIIFTCMNSRAVHIEIAHTMDTSSCIDAIRRFTARRGSVKEMHSDNGTNFVGANNELRRCLEELDEQTIQNFASSHGIKWQFNTPAASHHGGVWERQIRSVRKLLSAILNEQHLKTCKSDEQLHTLMCEVEATLNSRPLTRVSDEPNDLDVITPQDLLLLSPKANMPPGKFNERDIYSRRRWRQIQYLADLFWKRWVKEYLPELQTRQKWLQPHRNVQVGDVVLVVDDTSPRNSWPMGKVQQVHLDKKGLVRSVTVKTKSTVLKRPVTKVCLLLEQEDNHGSELEQTVTK